MTLLIHPPGEPFWGYYPGELSHFAMMSLVPKNVDISDPFEVMIPILSKTVWKMDDLGLTVEGSTQTKTVRKATIRYPAMEIVYARELDDSSDKPWKLQYVLPLATPDNWSKAPSVLDQVTAVADDLKAKHLGASMPGKFWIDEMQKSAINAAKAMKDLSAHPGEHIFDELEAILPAGVLDRYVPPPCECGYTADQSARTSGLKWVITHLNDHHHPKEKISPEKWTRDMIADWLDTLDIDLTITTKEET